MSQTLGDPSDPSGVTMDMDFGNLLDEIESVAMQDEDEALTAASNLTASSFDDSAFDSPGKTRTMMTSSTLGNDGPSNGSLHAMSSTGLAYATTPTSNVVAPLASNAAYFTPPAASSAPIADSAPIFEPQIRFGEIRSTPVHVSSPSGSSEGSIRRSSVGMRAQMKLMLMKQKMQDEEQKRDPPTNEGARHASSLTSLLTGATSEMMTRGSSIPISSSLPHVNANAYSASAGPVSTTSGTNRVAAFSHSPIASSLPSHVQPAPTRLCNPTKLFYQKQQERTCMNNGNETYRQQPASGDNSRTGSPAVAGGSENFLSVRPRLSQRQSRGSSPAMRPGDGSLSGLSPANDADLCGSAGTSVSELDDLFEEIAEGTLEKADPEEVDAITGLLKSTMTMPQSNSLSDVAGR